MDTNVILNGDALAELKKMPAESVNCVMTSPPYWALRDYGIEGMIWDGNLNCQHEFGESVETKSKCADATISGTPEYHKKSFTSSSFCKKCNAWKGQLGLEPTFDLYITHLCDIFDEVKRVLRKDGTCWINLGDSYGGSGNSSGHDEETTNCGKLTSEYGASKGNQKATKGLEKSLCNIPARFSIEMQNHGWRLRNVIIWYKPNCMPSSVKDRFTVDFEYLFFFVKNKKYWFETQYERLASSSLLDSRRDKGREIHKGKSESGVYGMNATVINSYGRNKRAVWKITTKPFKEAHFATYPEELCATPIKAGCPEFVCNKCGKAREKIEKIIGKQVTDAMKISGCDRHGKYYGNEQKDYNSANANKPSETKKRILESMSKIKEISYSDCGCNAGFSGGTVLDPFFGAGTTGLVALKQRKQFIGIELNPEYIKIAKERLKPYLEQTKLPQNLLPIEHENI